MSAAGRLGGAPAGDAVTADGTRRGWWASWLALVASGGTLVCCALPALLVTLGAGAALAGLVGRFPALVWLSEISGWVFAGAGLMLAAAGALQWVNRRAPCPIDPALRNACLRTRRWSVRVWAISVAIYAVGAWFAFVAPWWMSRGT
jgi:hypothetical protein